MNNKIENKLVFFNKEASFNERLRNREVQPESLVFIKDAKKIWTQNETFSFDPNEDPTIQQMQQNISTNTTNINNLMSTAIQADDEDTTVVDGKLKFADKDYDDASFSGYARKYLRLNEVVYYKDKIYRTEVPFYGFVSDVDVQYSEFPLNSEYESEMKPYFNTTTNSFVFKLRDTYYYSPYNYYKIQNTANPLPFDGFAPAGYVLEDYDAPAQSRKHKVKRVSNITNETVYDENEFTGSISQEEIDHINNNAKILWSRENHCFVFWYDGSDEYVDIKYCNRQAYKTPNVPVLVTNSSMPNVVDETGMATGQMADNIEGPFYGASYMFYTNVADSTYKEYNIKYYYIDPADSTNTLVEYPYTYYTRKSYGCPVAFTYRQGKYLWIDHYYDSSTGQEIPTPVGTVSIEIHFDNASSYTINYVNPNDLYDPNTVYYIQYDYNLTGQGRWIGDNSVLFFVGGSLCNGVIVGHNSSVYGEVRTTCPNVIGSGSFAGSWRNAGVLTPNDNLYEGKPFLHEGYNKMLYFRTNNGGADRIWMDAHGFSPMDKSGETRPTVPTTDVSIDNTGYCFFDTTLNKPVFWNGTKWVDAEGFNAVATRGTTADRPTDVNIGYKYYDTGLGKYIYYAGSGRWVDEEGFFVGKHVGTYAEALELLDSLDGRDLGYRFYATDLNKNIHLEDAYQGRKYNFSGFVENVVMAQTGGAITLSTQIPHTISFDTVRGRFVCKYDGNYYDNWISTDSDKYINVDRDAVYVNTNGGIKYKPVLLSNFVGQLSYRLEETNELYDWCDQHGYTPSVGKGTTAEREALLSDLNKYKDEGHPFFDTDFDRTFYVTSRVQNYSKSLTDIIYNGTDYKAFQFGRQEAMNQIDQNGSLSITTSVECSFDVHLVVTDEINGLVDVNPSGYTTSINSNNSLSILHSDIEELTEGATEDWEYLIIIPNMTEVPVTMQLNYREPSETLMWVDKNGRTANRLYGTKEQMPINLNNTTDIGYEFYLIDLEKPFYWDGSQWVDGNSIVHYQNEN